MVCTLIICHDSLYLHSIAFRLFCTFFKLFILLYCSWNYSLSYCYLLYYRFSLLVPQGFIEPCFLFLAFTLLPAFTSRSSNYALKHLKKHLSNLYASRNVCIAHEYHQQTANHHWPSSICQESLHHKVCPLSLKKENPSTIPPSATLKNKPTRALATIKD